MKGFRWLTLGRAMGGMALVMMAAPGLRADDDAKLDKTISLDPQKGFDILMTVPMAGGIIKTADLDRLWEVWEPAERAKAEQATPEVRHKMTFERYGLIARNDGTNLPLGYTEDGNGNLVTNCFSCHGGKVAGKTIPGVGNTHTDLTGLVTDFARLTRKDHGADPSTVKDVKAPFNTPFNSLKGVTNATMFALVLGAMRDKDLELTPQIRNPGVLAHNDMDAPPWWHFKRKEMIYCDAFAPKSTRTLMQFTMSPGNTGEMIRGWEGNFEQIKAYINSLQPPKYPYPVDTKLAGTGRELFEMTCARCHGTYGADAKFPNKVIPLKDIGTDPVRLGAIPSESRELYNTMWFSNYGEHKVNVTSAGYLAQPLDGIWASAPYFHNGSVPTIQHVFNPKDRPTVWKRTEDGYDQKRIGLEVEELAEVPAGLNSRETRTYYDTRTVSHSNGGHTYPDELNAEEKVAVMEYLKTL